MMARFGLAKLNSPRKSAIAKAALRKSAVSSPVKGHKPASKAELAEALAQRPKVDFLDPFMRHAAMQAKGISLCAFLVTLAAFQRGLKLTFHYERASFDPRFAKAKVQGHRGELFSISNGTRTHTFSRVLGDLTDPAANAIAEDKHLTKAALKRAGLRTPEGIVVDKSQTALVEKFLAQHPGKRFVVKPHDGSLGNDVFTKLSAEDVLATIKKLASNRILVEHHIYGKDYRALAVDGRVIASYVVEPANVCGDGSSSIKQLIDRKNAVRARNPKLYDAPIADIDKISGFLAQSGLTVDSVPLRQQIVFLNDVYSSAQGGDTVDTSAEAIDELHSAAVQACNAIGILAAGLDIILSEDEGIPYILEINQRPHIGTHSFPFDGSGQGNAVAEAIVDYYFPESIRNKTHPTLAYDFGPIRAVLESGQISELSLPIIGPDWRVMRFVEKGIAAKAMAKLIASAARTAGVFVMSAPVEKGGVELCLAYEPSDWRAFLNVIPPQLRIRLEQFAKEVA